MKRVTFIVVAMLMSIASFAQAKGEHYIAGTFSADFGTQKTTFEYGLLPSTFAKGAYSESSKTPLNTKLALGAEYGHFVANNFRLAMALGVSYQGIPLEETNIKWLRNKTVSFVVNPNVSYYFPLADRLYYTPEIGASFEFGSIKEELTLHEAYTTPATGWAVYVNLLALEYRVSEKAALGILVGGFHYGTASVTIIDTFGSESKYKSSQAKFDFNTSSIHFRYYL